MAEVSDVKNELIEISKTIDDVGEAFSAEKTRIEALSAQLGALPTVHADVLAEIDLYTPTGPFETLAQDEKAKLTTEFVALKAAIDAVIAEF